MVRCLDFSGLVASALVDIKLNFLERDKVSICLETMILPSGAECTRCQYGSQWFVFKLRVDNPLLIISAFLGYFEVITYVLE